MAGSSARHDDGAQRHRVRHPRERPRRPLVHRAGADGRGLYFPGFGPEDANPDIGDSAITETAGLGGFAMAAAPAIVQFVGGTPADALALHAAMYEITLAEARAYRIPALDFRGTPTGIDVRRCCRPGSSRSINTGIAHREPGIGQVGAGIVHPPPSASSPRGGRWPSEAGAARVPS